MEFQLFHTTLSASLLLFIMAGGFLAGFVDSIAGGGGLISLPVLLAAGLPPHLAIGTNKFSATFGAVMSAWQFWRAGKVDMSLLKRILPGTFIGAILGCLVMLHLKSEWLQPIIIIALIAAAVFVFSQRQLGAASTYSGNTCRCKAGSDCTAEYCPQLLCCTEAGRQVGSIRKPRRDYGWCLQRFAGACGAALCGVQRAH